MVSQGRALYILVGAGSWTEVSRIERRRRDRMFFVPTALSPEASFDGRQRAPMNN